MSSSDCYAPPTMERVSPIPVGAVPVGPLDASSPLDLTAARILDSLPFIRNPLCIYVSGSVALGWNHARSDLDIYVVTREPVPVKEAAGQHWTFAVDADPPTVDFFQGALGPYRAHVMFWLEGQVDSVIARLPPRNDLAAVYGLNRADADFAYKLSIARPLSGEGWLSSRQERLKQSGLAPGLSVWNVANSYSLLEDVEGCLLSGDLDSAVVMAQEAYRRTIDALLHSHGDVNHLNKWRARLVRSVAPAAVSFEEFWATETMAGFDAENPRPWVERTAHRCHDLLIGVAQTLDHDA